jgi:hypothetical protein
MIKAIETVYDGYRFRSRLEARWAVFFNALGIKYEYEKEGFDLDGTWYLPDFWLPEYKYWIEIKGQNAKDQEENKCSKLTDMTHHPTFLFSGSIPLPDYEICDIATLYIGDDIFSASKYERYAWSECPFCEKINITKFGSIDQLVLSHNETACGCISRYTNNQLLICLDDMIKSDQNSYRANLVQYRFFYWGNTPRLKAAYTAARQARFEHGERG